MRTSQLAVMRDKIAEALSLATRKGASAAKISFTHSENRACQFESGRLKECHSADTMGYSIALVINGRRGTATSNIPAAMNDMVERAVAIAASGAVAHFTEYPAPGRYPSIQTFSPEVLTITREKTIADCQNMVDQLKTADASLDISAGAGISENESIVANSAGLMHENRSTSWNLGLGIQKTTGTDMMFSGAGRGWREWNNLYDPDYLVNEILFDLRHASRFATIPDGVWPVFVPPRALPMFLHPITLGINGRNVFKGDSPLKDRLGTTCFAENLSILDNPHLDFAPSSAPFDSAGIPTQKRWLIENGVLKTFLYDLDTAKLAGQEPTGNSGCSPYTMLVQPGQETAAQLLSSIQKGIYLKSLLGFGQSNIINGDFSANLALGYLIENGEIVGRLKNVMLAGNILDLLKGDVRFSSDCDPQNQQPAAVLEGISAVSAKA
ncbi:MAG: peptidase PmbA [Lentisphaerae bacterium ADurb.Bin082]|nr:MAG: peptidase PmbA [Lentisphaerae bacterium ADurb.Bin082]